MKISSNSNGIASIAPASVSSGAPAVVAAPEVDRASAAESSLLKPAREALASLPDEGIDQARVAELREALARGEIRFDAGRLAALIQRYHGSK